MQTSQVACLVELSTLQLIILVACSSAFKSMRPIIICLPHIKLPSEKYFMIKFENIN